MNIRSLVERHVPVDTLVCYILTEVTFSSYEEFCDIRENGFEFYCQGMLTVTSEVATTPTILLNLWKHECNRVIADRFTNQQDKDWFEKTLKQLIEEDFDADTANLMDAEPYFVDFLRDAPEPTGTRNVLAYYHLSPSLKLDEFNA